MRFELLDSRAIESNTATIRRITALGIPWRVLAEVWPARDGWSGRLIFAPDSPAPHFEPRQGPATLRGRSQDEILDAAHRLSERRLRELLHSLA